MAEKEKYMIKFKGKLDLKQLIQMKHPLQQMLRRGNAPTAQLRIVKEEQAFVVEDYYGSRDDLEEMLAKLMPKIHAIHSTLAKDYSLETLTTQQYKQIKKDGSGVDVQEQRDLIANLEYVLEEKQEEYAGCLEEVERLQKENEKAKVVLSEAQKAAEYKIEAENFRKANEGLTKAKRKAELDFQSAQEDYLNLQEDYNSLSKLLEGINGQKITEPSDLVLKNLSESTGYLNSVGVALEDLLKDSSIDELLPISKYEFFEFVNAKLDTKYASNEEIMKASSVMGPFAETDYAKENAGKYAKADQALAALSSMKTMPEMFGQAVDMTKLLEKEEELRSFLSDYKSRQQKHDESLQVSNQLQGIRAGYEKAESLGKYLEQVKDRMVIPCLITYNPNNNKTIINLPNSKYFLKQLKPTIQGLEGIEFDEHESGEIALYTCDGSVNPPYEVASLLHAKQKETEFAKLGFKLQIYTVTKHD